MYNFLMFSVRVNIRGTAGKGDAFLLQYLQTARCHRQTGRVARRTVSLRACPHQAKANAKAKKIKKESKHQRKFSLLSSQNPIAHSRFIFTPHSHLFWGVNMNL